MSSVGFVGAFAGAGALRVFVFCVTGNVCVTTKTIIVCCVLLSKTIQTVAMERTMLSSVYQRSFNIKIDFQKIQ